jgi:hypothetical protein
MVMIVAVAVYVPVVVSLSATVNIYHILCDLYENDNVNNVNNGDGNDCRRPTRRRRVSGKRRAIELT